MKKAFITGITGQDGSYLAELLLVKGYQVHGLIRRSSTLSTQRIEHLYRHPRLKMHYGDLSEPVTLCKLLHDIKPDEIYNLGAQTHVRLSFTSPAYTAEIDAIGVLNLLEAIRQVGLKNVKFYQASSSELFGNSPMPVDGYNEDSLIEPCSPYGVAKAYAYHLVKMYRKAYGLFAINGILFNHESPRRGETFVSRKIAKGVARVAAKLDKTLTLGNLTAFRDWGYAPEFVDAIYLMMQQETPQDYVVATGESYSVSTFLNEAASYLGLDIDKFVKYDEKLLRPLEVHYLKGNSRFIKDSLGWEAKTKFQTLIKILVDAEVRETQKEILLRNAGFK